MNTEVDKIIIKGITYVPENQAQEMAAKVDGLDYVIIRADRAGVFAGYLEEDNNEVVILKEARRIWRWYGAASLSQLAVDGTSDPGKCKFPAEVARIKVLGVIENIPCTEKARKSIRAVAIWEQ